MTTKDEALALALEALEKVHYEVINSGVNNYALLVKRIAEAHEAITAIKQAQQAPVTELIERIADIISSNMYGVYHCTRVWEAWSVGTMSEEDFESYAASDSPRELAEMIVAALHPAPKQAEPEGYKLVPEQVEAAWRAGWAACRDAEFVGEEAEDEAWGMSETCANSDWESTAPKQAEPANKESLTVPEGYKLVRVEPTLAMLYAIQNDCDIMPQRGKRIWATLLAAAPTPPEAKA